MIVSNLDRSLNEELKEFDSIQYPLDSTPWIQIKSIADSAQFTSLCDSSKYQIWLINDQNERFSYTQKQNIKGRIIRVVRVKQTDNDPTTKSTQTLGKRSHPDFQNDVVEIIYKKTDQPNTSLPFFVHTIRNKKAQMLSGKVTKFEDIMVNNWNFEERELLKKALLSFGFNRWSVIQTCFREHRDFGLREKSVDDIKAYSKSLIKSIADNLNYKNFGLRLLLMSMISDDSSMGNMRVKNGASVQEQKDTKILYVNSRDWDLNSIRQRAKPWAKRLQIMYRVNNFIHDFQDYFKTRFGSLAESFLDYSSMLDYLHKSLLTGQKPCVWWTKIFDLHLVMNTFHIGYANYNFSFMFSQDQVPEDASVVEYLSKDDENMRNYFDNFKADFYAETLNNDMPNADAVTRRMKKIVQLICKGFEETKGDETINDTHLLDVQLDAVSLAQKRKVMDFIANFGVSYNETLGVVDNLSFDRFQREFLQNQSIPKWVQSDETGDTSITDLYAHKLAEYFFTSPTKSAPLYGNNPTHLPVSGILSNSSKPSFDDIRCRLKSETSLDANGIQKLFQGLKLTAFSILNDRHYKSYRFSPDRHNPKLNELASLFDKEQAEKFLRQLTISHMVRKYLVGRGLFTKHFKHFKTRIMCIRRDCPRVKRLKSLSHFNFCEVLLAEVNDHGFLRLYELAKFVDCSEQDLHGRCTI